MAHTTSRFTTSVLRFPQTGCPFKVGTCSFTWRSLFRLSSPLKVHSACRFCRLHKHEVERRLDRPKAGAIVIKFAKVHSDP